MCVRSIFSAWVLATVLVPYAWAQQDEAQPDPNASAQDQPPADSQPAPLTAPAGSDAVQMTAESATVGPPDNPAAPNNNQRPQKDPGQQKDPARQKKPDQKGEQWRFKLHNDSWWYWLPSNQWVFWNGSQWIGYSLGAYDT